MFDKEDLRMLTIEEEIKKQRRWVRWLRRIKASDLDTAERCLQTLTEDKKRKDGLT